MQSTRSSHYWLARFCIRFIALRGDLPWQRVVARAVAAYPYCSDQDPDEAALAAAASVTGSTMMNIQQLMGRYLRLKQDLEIAYKAQPWHSARIN